MGCFKQRSLMDTLTPSRLQGSPFPRPHQHEAGVRVQGGLRFPFRGTIDLLTVLTYGIPDRAQVSFLSCSLGVSGVEMIRGYGMKCREVPQHDMMRSRPTPPSCSRSKFNQQNQGMSPTKHPINFGKVIHLWGNMALWCVLQAWGLFFCLPLLKDVGTCSLAATHTHTKR